MNKKLIKKLEHYGYELEITDKYIFIKINKRMAVQCENNRKHNKKYRLVYIMYTLSGKEVKAYLDEFYIDELDKIIEKVDEDLQSEFKRLFIILENK